MSQAYWVVVRDRGTGAAVMEKRLDFASFGSDNPLFPELVKNYRHELEGQYPSAEFEIIDGPAADAAELIARAGPILPPASPGTFRMQADSERSMGMVNLLAFGFIAVVAVVLTLLTGMAGGAVALFMAAIGAFYLIDYLFFVRRGVRAVHMDADGITVYRGKRRAPTRIAAAQISGVNVFSKGPRVIVNIMTGGAASRAAGVTLFSGPRVRLTNDAFNDDDFIRFIVLVKALQIRGQASDPIATL
jgi:hypothetical protein